MLRILKDQRGFTLIELVIIIILIAVLAGVAIPRFVNLRGEALTAKAKAMQDAGRAALVLDFAADTLGSGYTAPFSCGTYPCDVTSGSAELTYIHDQMEGRPSYPPDGTYGSAAGTGFRWRISDNGSTNTPAVIYGVYDGADVDDMT